MFHFQTVRFGGFDEGQMIRYLWSIVKAVEAAQNTEHDREAERFIELGKQMWSQAHVEIHRYFVRRRRGDVEVALRVTTVILCIAVVLGFLIGIDRVSSDSMCPYLNHGDQIVYSRISMEYRRNEVTVFEKNEGCMVEKIAGQSGDRVEASQSGSRAVMNGVQSQEGYVALLETFPGDENERNSGETGVVRTMMDGQYLVSGDNHSVSIDSRDSSIGTAPPREMLGKAILVIRRNRE